MISNVVSQPAVVRLKDLDPEVDERVISAVFEEPGGWRIFADTPGGSSRLIWVPERPSSPRVGDRVKIYGLRYLRGLDINEQEIFYTLPPEWDIDIFDEADLEG